MCVRQDVVVEIRTVLSWYMVPREGKFTLVATLSKLVGQIRVVVSWYHLLKASVVKTFVEYGQARRSKLFLVT